MVSLVARLCRLASNGAPQLAGRYVPSGSNTLTGCTESMRANREGVREEKDLEPGLDIGAIYRLIIGDTSAIRSSP